MAGSSPAARLSREDVVETALALLGESGLDAVTLRGIARRCGVRLNSVAWHVKSKTRLLESMADALLSSLSLDGLPDDGLERAREVCRRYRAVLLSVRDGARLVSGTFVPERHTLRVADALIAALLDAGFDDRDAATTCWVLSYFVVGLTQEQQNVGTALPDEVRTALAGGEFPAFRRTFAHVVDHDFDERFEVGVGRLLRTAPPITRAGDGRS